MATATAVNPIRDLRESKGLSQIKVSTACDLPFRTYVRIEQGSGKTTPAEVASVMKVLKGMEASGRKLAGRPFKDPAKQAAVVAARAEGKSVAAALGLAVPSKDAAKPVPAKAATKPAAAKAPAAKATKTPAKPASDMAKALAKKAPSRAPRKPAAAKA